MREYLKFGLIWMEGKLIGTKKVYHFLKFSILHMCIICKNRVNNSMHSGRSFLGCAVILCSKQIFVSIMFNNFAI
jgi:hypothetical protein